MAALENGPSEGSGPRVPGNFGNGPMTIDLLGIKTIDHNGFSADFLRGDAVRGQRDVLVPITARIDANTFKKDIAEAMDSARHKYDLVEEQSEEPNSTSMILYRRMGAQIGDYKGYSLQQELEIQTSRGTERVLFWVTRAFQIGFRDRKLGRFDMQQGLVRHENVDAIFHRTINPASPWSVHQARVVNERLYFPWAWASLYGIKESQEAGHALEIMYGGFFILRTAGIAKSRQVPNDATGVAIADEGPNLAYEVKDGHQPTADIL